MVNQRLLVSANTPLHVCDISTSCRHYDDNCNQRSCTGLGAKPQDMTALSIDYVITLIGGAPSDGRCHTNVNTIEKLCIVLLFFLILLNKSNT